MWAAVGAGAGALESAKGCSGVMLHWEQALGAGCSSSNINLRNRIVPIVVGASGTTTGRVASAITLVSVLRVLAASMAKFFFQVSNTEPSGSCGADSGWTRDKTPWKCVGHQRRLCCVQLIRSYSIGRYILRKLDGVLSR